MLAAGHSIPDPVSANTPATGPANGAYFPALDGLRAIAFLMVFSLHYLISYLPVSFGWAGVNVFFVLSGFLITGILYDTREAAFRYRNFYVRRTLRIFPLYYGIFVALLLLYPLCRWEWSWGWLAWPSYLGNFAVLFRVSATGRDRYVAGALLVSSIFPALQLSLGHFWTLCVEEQFYMLWPLVVFTVKDRRRLILVCLPFLIGCPLLRAFADHFVPAFALRGDAINYVTIFQVDALLLGAVLALLRRGPAERLLPSFARVLLVALPVLIGSLLLAFPTLRHLGPGGSMPLWRTSAKFSIADLLSAAILLLALEPRSIVYAALNRAPLRWLGRISYGAYVYHMIPLPWFSNLLAPHFADPGLPVAALSLLVTLSLAWLSYRFFESPFIQLKDRLTQTFSSTQAAGTVTPRTAT